MNRYQVIFFNTEHAQKTRSFQVTVLQPVLISLFILALIISLIFINLYSAKIKKQMASVKTEFQGQEALLSHSTEVIASAIDLLRYDEAFILDIYENTPIIQGSYSLGDITAGFSDHSNYLNFYNINKRNEFQNPESMIKLANQIDAELEKRIISYDSLSGFLEKQYVIFRHTPSIWPSPIERVTSLFGFRRSPFTGIPSYHEGTDFSAPLGTPIPATADGVVVFAGTRTGYGYLVTIDHGFGYMTRYAHNSRLLVKSGDKVRKGDIISLSGATGRSAGPHLHYEVLYNGAPVNSKKFLPNEN